MFKGSITAMVTPFHGDSQAVDWAALEALVDWQITEGSHGLVPVGTTGESPTLTPDEHKQVVQRTVRIAAGRVPVIAGAGSNSTAEAVDFARHGEKAGADALLVVTPYYNKPSQEGLFQHYRAVAAATSLPIFIYNIPGRSIVDMTVETMQRLSEIPNIVGVKDATAKIDRVSAQRQAMGPDFIQLSGEDGTAIGYMAHGGHGCISVTSNVAPRLCGRFQEACLRGDFAAALAIQDKLFPLHQALFAEPNPQGPKYALARLGKLHNVLRLPMVPLGKATEAVIDEALAHAGLV